jgi:quinol monooxygenase YgiN
MNSKLCICFVLALAFLISPTRGDVGDVRQAPAKPSPIYVLTFIDLLPVGLGSGVPAIKQYVIDTRKEPGIMHCEAVAQVAGRINHLMVLEVWKDLPAFEKHEGTTSTLDFRKKLAPLLGAPFDQRVSFVVE